MKKVFAILLSVIMVLGLSFSSFAADNSFTSSPSGKLAPTLVSFRAGSEDCTATLSIVPFSERDKLPDELRDLIEKAYKSIVDCTNLTDLCDALEALAAQLGIDPSDLAISDLFDLQTTACENCGKHHGNFSVGLSFETLGQFVAFLHMNKDGEWELVDGATVTDGNILNFDIDDFSPFAVVVRKDSAGTIIDGNTGVVDGNGTTSDVPQTGDNSMITTYIIAMAVSVVVLAVVVVAWKKSKKQEA